VSTGEGWRERLRLAVQRSGVTQAEIARRAGVAPETLSRVLHGIHARPEFSTVVRIARAARVRVSWLLDEPEMPRGIVLSDRERATVIAAGVILLDAFRR
jgi:transcriptional regulator with XRE-family HTH domain